MQTKGSVVVLLQRPVVRLDREIPQLHPRDAPWLLTTRDDLMVYTIRPAAEVLAMIIGNDGFFYARLTEDEWQILGPVPANDS